MGWSIVELGAISELITKGTTPTSIGFKFSESGVNFIKVESISIDGKFISEKFAAISEECNQALGRSQLKCGDILFSIAGALGRAALVTDSILPANTNQALAIIRLKKEVKIDKNYLLYALKTGLTMEQVEKHRGGVAQQNLSLTQLKSFRVSTPPITEQKSIVAILDKAFADIDRVRELIERNLQNARELFESYLQQVFSQYDDSWIETTLGEVADFKNGLNFSQSSKGEKLKIVGVKDFKSNFMVPHEQLDEIQIDGELSEAYELKENDIIAVRSNGNKRLIGRCLLMGKVDNKISYSGFTIRIRLSGKNLNSAFVAYYLKSASAHELLINSGEGANISNLNQKILSALPIVYPMLSEQEKILPEIKHIEIEAKNLAGIYEKKLFDLDELKKSLLQKAFTGELTKDSKGVAA